eukprot:comp21605_c0_seq2/m.30267 comp21605_c0_seq2/g.30267  ORF comp21605_c0_seq2/g.30267 comp21605_c0_seq2/m.30267 type:complete len:661 (-) comp21605_c0_seq2:522-2504(-)
MYLNVHRWDLTPEQIKEQSEALITNTRATLDAIAARPQSEITFENTIKALADLEVFYHTQSNVLEFPQFVSTDKGVRDASMEADKALSAFSAEWDAREDIYKIVKAFSEAHGPMEGEAGRFIERTLRDFRRSGLHLDKETREKVKELKVKMNNLTVDFDKNVNEENTKLLFTAEELDGMPKDFIAGLDTDAETGKYVLTLKYPHYIPLMKKCAVPETRRKMEYAYNTRCIGPNTAIVEELGEIRHTVAQLLGYPTHAAFIAEARMAKTPEAIQNFLDDMKVKVKPLSARDMAEFLELKKKECETRGIPFDGQINLWDAMYYVEKLEEEKYKVDHEHIKEYFPMDVVTNGLLHIYQVLLGLTFEQVADPHTWHDDVTLYSVKDTASGQLLGYFYLDLYPREAKYSHAACFGLQPGCLLPDGSRQVTVAACVCNFTKPHHDVPSLLQHSEVETFFHEFGHVMHQICSQANYAMFAGTQVERDFVEAPSQMLENWVWEEEPLRWLSGHYKTKELLPNDLIEKLVASRKASAGYLTMRQLFLATIDQTIYRQPRTDTRALVESLAKDMDFPYTPGTNMVAAFGHVARGYDGQYYGYMWSEVFSFDMFETRFKREGILNPSVGMDYRTQILQPGGSQDASDMLLKFLGRQPQPEAFLRTKLGLGA